MSLNNLLVEKKLRHV